ncbi:MAG: MASE3 domain-containing protein [Bacteroidota bacterium]
MEDGRQTLALAKHPVIGSGGVAAFGLFGVAMCALWATNFLLFHTLAELMSVVVAFAAAVVAWYSRDWIGRNYLLLLGAGQFFVGCIDIVHTLGYKGIHIFQANGGNLSTQLWLSARALEATTFLMAVWAPQRRYNVVAVVGGLAVVAAALVAAAFANVWPATFVEGVGVTPVKTGAELVLVGVFAAVLLRLRGRSADFDPAVYRLLVLSVSAKLLTELVFSSYSDLFGMVNLFGHMFKIVGAWLLLRAVVDSGLRRPQSLIFGALARERALSGEVALHARTLDAVLDATLAPVLMIDGGGQIRFASRAAEQFLERGTRELTGRSWREAGLPEALMLPLEALAQQVLASGQPRTEEYALTLRGNRLCLELQVSPVGGNDRNAVPAVVAFLRDITARKAMEENLKASLADNRVLIQEVHHRVKNNLQIVSSILQMQGWRVVDPAVRQHFEEACGRILSLAKVHELIYKQDTVASLDFTLFARTLCGELFRMHDQREGQVVLTVRGDAMPLGVDKAEPLALIVHELVVDALKHAFGADGGHLRVDVGEMAPAGEAPRGEGVLVIAEDGGAPDRALDFEGTSTALGLRMVGALVKQMHGTITVARGAGGVEVEIRFPLADTPAAP